MPVYININQNSATQEEAIEVANLLREGTGQDLIVQRSGYQEGHWQIYTVLYKGCVVRSENEYAGDTHDNYFAIIWDAKSFSFKRVWVYHTGYGGGYMRIDADDETIEAEAESRRYQDHLQRLRFSNKPIINLVEKGDFVTTTRKLKNTPRGTTGKVFWVGVPNWSKEMRVGFKDAEGNTHWANLKSCQVSTVRRLNYSSDELLNLMYATADSVWGGPVVKRIAEQDQQWEEATV